MRETVHFSTCKKQGEKDGKKQNKKLSSVEGNCVLILQIAKDNYVGKKLSLKRLVNASGTNDITILCDAIYRMSGTKISQKEALKIKPFYKRGGVVIYGYPMGYNVIVTRIQKGVCETGKVSFK